MKFGVIYAALKRHNWRFHLSWRLVAFFLKCVSIEKIFIIFLLSNVSSFAYIIQNKISKKLSQLYIIHTDLHATKYNDYGISFEITSQAHATCWRWVATQLGCSYSTYMTQQANDYIKVQIKDWGMYGYLGAVWTPRSTRICFVKVHIFDIIHTYSPKMAHLHWTTLSYDERSLAIDSPLISIEKRYLSTTAFSMRGILLCSIITLYIYEINLGSYRCTF